MAIFKNVLIRYARLDPAKPNHKFDKPDNKGGRWELQMVTYDKNQKDAWAKEGLRAKIQEEADKIAYVVTIDRKVINGKGEVCEGIQVVDAAKKPLDPKFIGNDSIANIRTFPYDYETDAGKKGVKHVLMGVQILHLKKYVPKPTEDFNTEGETSIELPDTDFGDDEEIAF